jgi:hypothetical protein
LVIALLLTSMIDQNHQPFFPLEPGEVLFLVFGLVAALYVLLRQPQEEGAPA